MSKLNRVRRKHKIQEVITAVKPVNYLIVTEGTETEVNYFRNIKRIIESLYSSSVIVIVEKIELDVHAVLQDQLKF